MIRRLPKLLAVLLLFVAALQVGLAEVVDFKAVDAWVSCREAGAALLLSLACP